MPPPVPFSHVPAPQKVEITGEGLLIVWDDGHRSLFPHRPLRLACRCAGCIDERTGQLILDPASVPMDVKILYTLPTGDYGLEILWSDGHGTGIYVFRKLRAGCPCDECKTGAATAAAK